MRSSGLLLAALLAAAIGCDTSPPPARLALNETWCGSCRMIISEQRFASQVVSSVEEPVFFDDLGCLAHAMARRTLPAGGSVYVADHRTGEWVAAGAAVFTRVDGFTAPMGSPIVAHASAASRAADPAASAGRSIGLHDVLPGWKAGNR